MSDEKFDDLKHDVAYVEEAHDTSSGRVVRPAREFSGKEEDRLYRKMDIRMLPTLAVLYLMSFMDRGNIGNARLAGLEADLKMGASQYAVALSVFFITYCLFEVPSNLMLQKFRPTLWIVAITLSWGIVMTLMGVVQSYAGLVITRTVLGATEAGLFPGVVLLLTFFYPRDRMQTRIALFFSAATIAGAFSGLLAYGIGFMNGVGGYSGWRWIFILEGLLTILVGAVSYFTLVDRPQTAKWLTEDEKAWVIYRKATETSASGVGENSHISWRLVKLAFSDFQCWLGILFYLSILVPLYGVGLFMPSLILSFGKFSRPHTQLLTIPVYMQVACAWVVGTSILADKRKTRFPFLLANQILCLIGFTINLTPAPYPVKFVGLIFAACGCYGGVPTMVSWLTGNLAGETKRAVGSGLTLGIASLGGVISSNIYRKPDAPRYLLGHGTELGVSVLGIFASCMYAYLLRRANRAKLAEQLRQSQLPESQRTVYTARELQELGDKSPEFMYRI
ncbi:hypothetical protein OIV83_003046 [Microbotryomycetes sp. JL201]|nr:hypothetical protein OIV83_003046 [Microbotryomycetes sp. JL201]